MLKVKEKILLFRIRTQRDGKAYDEIVVEHASALRRFFRMKLPREEDAEDAFSVTLFRVWNYLTASEVESLSGLIYTIARSVVAEFYRSRKVEMVPIDGYDKDTGDDQEKELEVKLEVEKVSRKIKELFDEDERLTFQLRYLDGYKIKEVAKKIGKSETATSMMLHRLLKRLRAELVKKYDQ